MGCFYLFVPSPFLILEIDEDSLTQAAVSSSCEDLEVAQDDNLKQLFQYLVRDYGVRPFGRVRQYPAPSCQEIQDAHYQILPSGEYWVSSNGEEPRKTYCEF